MYGPSAAVLYGVLEILSELDRYGSLVSGHKFQTNEARRMAFQNDHLWHLVGQMAGCFGQQGLHSQGHHFTLVSLC